MATPKQNRSSSRTDFPKLENQPTFYFHIFLPFKSESRRSVDRVGSTLGASPPSSVREPERAPSPVAKAPMVMTSSPFSKPVAKAKNILGGAIEQLLAVMPITVWNPPSESARPPPRRVEELKRKNPK